MDRDELLKSLLKGRKYQWSVEEQLNDILSLLARELEKARKGLIAVKDLIENSYGVVGLHLNGDPAPWDSLLEGGQFEDWLKDFSEAIKEAT